MAKNEVTTKKKEKPGVIVINATKKIVLAVISAIVGAVCGGGVIGSIAGTAVATTITTGEQLIERYKARKQEKAERALIRAMVADKIDDHDLIEKLGADEKKADVIFMLLKQAAELDSSFEQTIANLIRAALNTEQDEDLDLIEEIIRSLSDLRNIHLRVLKAIGDAGGELSPEGIAEATNYGQVELRSVVRKLELDGMIEWVENDPRGEIWRLREFGIAIVNFIYKGE